MDRLAFAGTSPAVGKKRVPYWQSAHSILRTMTVQGSYMVQNPAEEITGLRSNHKTFGECGIFLGAVLQSSSLQLN